MGVKIVKGIAGQYEALHSTTNQAAQAKSSSSPALQTAQATAAFTDAVVNSVRGGKSEGGERLTLEKAEKVAKDLKEQILSDEETALDAVGKDFSLTAVRDAFGV